MKYFEILPELFRLHGIIEMNVCLHRDGVVLMWNEIPEHLCFYDVEVRRMKINRFEIVIETSAKQYFVRYISFILLHRLQRVIRRKKQCSGGDPFELPLHRRGEFDELIGQPDILLVRRRKVLRKFNLHRCQQRHLSFRRYRHYLDRI